MRLRHQATNSAQAAAGQTTTTLPDTAVQVPRAALMEQMAVPDRLSATSKPARCIYCARGRWWDRPDPRNPTMTLAELQTDLRDFVAGGLPADALEHRLVAVIVRTGLELVLPGGALDESPAERLVAKLAFHFEDLQSEPDASRREAATIVAALDALSPAAVLDLLPLLLTRDRFANIVQKHQAGIISRTSFVAAVSSARLPRVLQEWLYAASLDSLSRFASCLRSDDLRELQQLTGLAAA